MLINTLLNRHEIEGFQTVAMAAPPQDTLENSEPEKPKPPAPRQHPCKRHRRGL